MKIDMKWKAFGILILVFGALLLLTMKADYTKETIPEKTQTAQKTQNEGPLAPNFALKDLNGDVVSLNDYRGKLVFVNFWATWCPPCRAEIPHFTELVDKYGSDGFAIIGISVDNPKDFKKIPGFVDQYNINYPVLFGDPNVSQQYGGIESIPTTFVIDQEGRALGKIVGARSYEQFEDIIKRFL